MAMSKAITTQKVKIRPLLKKLKQTLLQGISQTKVEFMNTLTTNQVTNFMDQDCKQVDHQ